MGEKGNRPGDAVRATQSQECRPHTHTNTHTHRDMYTGAHRSFSCTQSPVHTKTAHTQAHRHRHTHTSSPFTPTTHGPSESHMYTQTHTPARAFLSPSSHTRTQTQTTTPHPPPTPLRSSSGLHPVWCPRLKPLATWRPGARSWQPRKSETRTEYLNLTQASVLGQILPGRDILAPLRRQGPGGGEAAGTRLGLEVPTALPWERHPSDADGSLIRPDTRFLQVCLARQTLEQGCAWPCPAVSPRRGVAGRTDNSWVKVEKLPGPGRPLPPTAQITPQH